VSKPLDSSSSSSFVLDEPAFFCSERARLSRNYFVPLFLLRNIRIFEDDDEEESSNSEFGSERVIFAG
jgi:hypothetical protein